MGLSTKNLLINYDLLVSFGCIISNVLCVNNENERKHYE